MAPKGWRGLHIPENMANEIDQFIDREEVKSKYAFGSLPEFVRRAVSNYIVQIERELAIGTEFILTPEEHRKRDQEEKKS